MPQTNGYTYKDQLDILKPILSSIKEGTSLRIDCPFCGGKNTFGINKRNGSYQYGCFRASCKISGRKDYNESVSSLKDRLAGLLKSKENTLPDTLLSIASRPELLDWLSSYNSLSAYQQNLVDIKYDPYEDRVMFPIVYDGKVTGYTGRSPLNDVLPKWRRYADCSHLFTCGNGETGVLVEDACSACAAGVIQGITGISILGTTLSTQHKHELKDYAMILVCLDADATLKGLEMTKQLSGYTNATLRIIKDDLKYLSVNQIRTVLRLD